MCHTVYGHTSLYSEACKAATFEPTWSPVTSSLPPFMVYSNSLGKLQRAPAPQQACCQVSITGSITAHDGCMIKKVRVRFGQVSQQVWFWWHTPQQCAGPVEECGQALETVHSNDHGKHYIRQSVHAVSERPRPAAPPCLDNAQLPECGTSSWVQSMRGLWPINHLDPSDLNTLPKPAN